LSAEGRGRLRAIYEQIYNHYVNRMGLAAPHTQQAAEKMRPEQQGLPGADHVGFGTLLYSRVTATDTGNDTNAIPTAPAGLLAQTSLKDGNTITWVVATGTDYYTIKRSERKNGPYTIVASKLNNAIYRDHKVVNNRTYYYTVSAFNKSGESTNAYPVSITTGLPANWQQADIGNEGRRKGGASFNGQQFTIMAGGLGLDSVRDQFKFVYTTLNGNGVITARYVPQLSSQFTSFGLVIREGLADNVPEVACIIKPVSSGQVEAPHWYTTLLSRVATDDQGKTMVTGPELLAPMVTFGRLTGYCWLRLLRRGDEFSAYSSVDGRKWTKIGSITCSLKNQVLVGLAASSGLATISTTISFDLVDLKQ
jgi:hypothetical protein